MLRRISRVLALVPLLALVACEPSDELPRYGEPLEEADLVPRTRGGVTDTAHLDGLAARLDATLTGELVVDVSDLSAEERAARRDALSGGSPAARQLADQQIKFVARVLGGGYLHLDLSTGEAELTEPSLSSGRIRFGYRATAAAVVKLAELEETGSTLEAFAAEAHTARVPGDPDAMSERVGQACLEEGQEGATADNYAYYYDGARSGCALALTEAEVAVVDARLELGAVRPEPTVFPEFDELTADGRLDVVAIFGVADTDWEPGEWDLGIYDRDKLLGTLRSRDFVEETMADGHQVFTRTLAELVERVTVIGPEALEVYPDADALLANLVNEHEVILYSGHSFDRSLKVLNQKDTYPDRYQIFLLNSCWRYEHFARHILRNKATEADPSGESRVDLITNSEPGWFRNMGAESRIVLTNLLRGAEYGGVDDKHRYFTWDRIVGGMNRLAIDQYRAGRGERHELYTAVGVSTNAYAPAK